MKDYVAMANYLLKSLEGIKEYQYNVEYCNEDWTDCNCEDITDEMIEKAHLDSIDCHWSFERASSRLHDVKKMIRFKDDEDFEYYAISLLINAKHRIESFLEDTRLEYPSEVYDTHKYDDILEDEKYLNCDSCFDKFYNMNYRFVMINYGLVDSINSVRESIDISKDIKDKDAQYEIVNKIEELSKQLDGYIEDY